MWTTSIAMDRNGGSVVTRLIPPPISDETTSQVNASLTANHTPSGEDRRSSTTVVQAGSTASHSIDKPYTAATSVPSAMAQPGRRWKGRDNLISRRFAVL